MAAFLSPVAAAAEPDVTATAPHAWTTTSHFGFGVVDRSTTGFEDSTGSLFFLDVARRIGPTVDLGVRTFAQGARNPGGEFYRLAAGPLVSIGVRKGWIVQGSVASFRETAMTGSGTETYRSEGYSVMFGWERTLSLGPRAELAWGSFVARHEGGISQPGESASGEPSAPTASINLGLSHGVEAAFRVRL